MIVYLSGPKNSTRELLQLINNFSKLAGYKINSNKSVAFLYSKDKQPEKEVREITHFKIATNNIKYLMKLDSREPNNPIKNGVPR